MVSISRFSTSSSDSSVGASGPSGSSDASWPPPIPLSGSAAYTSEPHSRFDTGVSATVIPTAPAPAASGPAPVAPSSAISGPASDAVATASGPVSAASGPAPASAAPAASGPPGLTQYAPPSRYTGLQPVSKEQAQKEVSQTIEDSTNKINALNDRRNASEQIVDAGYDAWDKQKEAENHQGAIGRFIQGSANTFNVKGSQKNVEARIQKDFQDGIDVKNNVGNEDGAGGNFNSAYNRSTGFNYDANKPVVDSGDSRLKDGKFGGSIGDMAQATKDYNKSQKAGMLAVTIVTSVAAGAAAAPLGAVTGVIAGTTMGIATIVGEAAREDNTRGDGKHDLTAADYGKRVGIGLASGLLGVGLVRVIGNVGIGTRGVAVDVPAAIPKPSTLNNPFGSLKGPKDISLYTDLSRKAVPSPESISGSGNHGNNNPFTPLPRLDRPMK